MMTYYRQFPAEVPGCTPALLDTSYDDCLTRKIYDWPCPTMVYSGCLADDMTNDSFRRLWSRRLKDLVESYVQDDDNYLFLPVRLVHARTKKLTRYFALVFPSPRDVLDMKRTTFVEDTDLVIKPVLALEKVGAQSIFTYPGSEDVVTFVHRDLAVAIQASGCSGIKFEPEA